MLLDQFDLNGPGLGDGHLDLDRAHFAIKVGSLQHDRQDVEGADSERAHPPRCGSEYIVDDVTELKKPELAVGPWLFEQWMSRWPCGHAASALLGVGFTSYLYTKSLSGHLEAQPPPRKTGEEYGQHCQHGDVEDPRRRRVLPM
jgi:hypothetical protein